MELSHVSVSLWFCREANLKRKNKYLLKCEFSFPFSMYTGMGL